MNHLLIRRPVRVEGLLLNAWHNVCRLDLRAALCCREPARKLEVAVCRNRKLTVGSAPYHVSVFIRQRQRAAFKGNLAEVVDRDLDRLCACRPIVRGFRRRGVDPVASRFIYDRVFGNRRVEFVIILADCPREHRIAVCNRSLFHHAADGKRIVKLLACHEFGLRHVELDVGLRFFDVAGDGEGLCLRAVFELIPLCHLVRERYSDGYGLAVPHGRRIVEGCDRAVCLPIPVGQLNLVFAVQIGHLMQLVTYVRAVIRSGDPSRVCCIAFQHRPCIGFIRLHRKLNRRPYRVARADMLRCGADKHIFACLQIRKRQHRSCSACQGLHSDVFFGYSSAVPFCRNRPLIRWAKLVCP